MHNPLLYRELHSQLSQWIHPKDKRHLQGFAENVAAILQSQSGCLSHWIPFLSHRDCQARSHLDRLSYFLKNGKMNLEEFYQALLRHCLQALAGSDLKLTLDTSMLWDEYCLISVCLIWGGRSLTLAQTVIEHKSATVAFEQYRPVLESVIAVLPPSVSVTLLADRGFEHGELCRWLNQKDWNWAIRAKCNLKVTFANGLTQSVKELFPPTGEAYLCQNVHVLDDISCHLALANLPVIQEPWAVLTNQPCSLQTFLLYSERFGGIEPHFKDYKSAGFDIIRSHLRSASALISLFTLLDTAYLISFIFGILLMNSGRLSSLDWHSQRGLSFLQLGLREIQRLCYLHLPFPSIQPLPAYSPPKAFASIRKRDFLETRIEFSRVSILAP